MENKVLATVGSEEITEKELNEIISKYPDDRKKMFENEQGRKQLLEQVISFELLNKFGKELKLDETDEYKETVKRLAKEILTQMSIAKILSEVTVTDEEVKEYYEANKDKFIEQPTVSAKHILVEKEEDALKIKEEIDNGITFEDAAKKYSSCPSKEQGGNLGVFGRGMMVPEFEDAAFNAEIGKVTEPVKTQFGYHLILVDSKNEAKTKTFEEVKDAVLQQLMQERQQRKYLDVLKELESKYGVVRK
ncbi:peptidyl-prolyl cis-trans isomerase C [Clostridium moniliforme]|uniref:Peptidyl-prolyl cis-trans isomerase C n=1 Tax=Clostridium moniliforme TaxID=39489 RepID=A0ABS4F2I4_9CLOT|nr:peptidyl-prolyl cis-trans isomerase [Clostridium moniliforme]MBP1890448.1 peptidyl-prolyl cis-trans isomerase C [Clostridium moniliforme]